jgi:radical SAM superfamily enzyme YgiQ (UPF0313 family)
MNILLVSPATPDTFWSYTHVLRFLAKKAAYPPLGLLTIAAMLPDDWQLRLVDLNTTDLQDTDVAWADYVLISAMLVHEKSVRSVIIRCQKHGKTMIAGGPLVSTAPERFPEIEHFVLGEAEGVMPALIADMKAGRLQALYQDSEKPDLRNTPTPRWDLIRTKDYVTMPLQFSRGCPFDCEFCDIVAMYGRVPRTKAPAQMIEELDSLYTAGWRGTIFIVDDNFIGHKGKAKALLREIIAWRNRRGASLPLLTEASLNLAEDPELLDLMVQAGFEQVFIGLETPDEASLVECAKVQNTQRDLLAAVRKIQSAGIEVMGGFILGFDNDPIDIFERQHRFIQEAGIVTAMVGMLTALPQTRLFQRLKEEGRLVGMECTSGNNLDAALNFVPRMDRDTLVQGYRRLVRHLYSPKEYYRRALTFLRLQRPEAPRQPFTRREMRAFVWAQWVLGVRTRGRRAYWRYFLRSLFCHRREFGEAMRFAILGHHFRIVAAQL